MKTSYDIKDIDDIELYGLSINIADDNVTKDDLLEYLNRKIMLKLGIDGELTINLIAESMKTRDTDSTIIKNYKLLLGIVYK